MWKSTHIEEPTLEEIVTATSIVIKDGKPGPLFVALGAQNGSHRLAQRLSPNVR